MRMVVVRITRTVPGNGTRTIMTTVMIVMTTAMLNSGDGECGDIGDGGGGNGDVDSDGGDDSGNSDEDSCDGNGGESGDSGDDGLLYVNHTHLLI